jgi:histidinol-phosphate/aromatic aminotransferase/cobyric acid decarboxylase-like protein
VAASAARAELVRVFTRDPALCLDLERVVEEARGARVVYVCSPNNPTGEGIAIERLAGLARALEPTLLVVDQSFLSLSDHAHDERVKLPANVIALRSLTKDFALAGLRIGYLLAAPELATSIESARPTWATSAPALAAIEQAARERDYVRESWRAMRACREQFRQGLRELGVSCVDGVAGYSLVHVGDAASFTRRLLAHKLFVRDASSFGLPQHVRVAARPEADTRRLLEAWAALRDGA